MEINKDKMKPIKALGVLKGIDDIEDNIKTDQITFLNIDLLDPFPNHPFKLYTGKKLENLCESIKKVGVLEPVIVKKAGKRYQILAGHNRHNASRLCGLATIKSIVTEVDDDTAKLIVVDTNFRQRQDILPSEKAFAYKMKLEALSHQGKKLTQETLLSSRKSRDMVAEEIGESGTQVQRYIRLTELTTDLLDMVDEGKLGFNTGVELSYLKRSEQELLYSVMQEEELNVKLTQAVTLKKLSSEKNIETADILNIIFEDSNKKENSIKINLNLLDKYYHGLTEKEIVKNIMNLIEANCNS